MINRRLLLDVKIDRYSISYIDLLEIFHKSGKFERRLGTRKLFKVYYCSFLFIIL